MRAVDLFAGAGGCSTGLLRAATKREVRVELTAVNHWPTAVETHTKNHPAAQHFCASVETLDPRVAVPSGKLDLLIAAPECVHFSSARGGRPMSDQSRASAWHILRWLELLRVDQVLVENVSEFQTWGQLGRNGRPIASKKGETFRAWVKAVESYGYRVEWKVLNAADYGAATTRRRLFVRASRGRTPIAWPEPTHSKSGSQTLFRGPRKWRGAREVIDWSLPSQSIFTRKRPLKPATLRRIVEGLRRFGGREIQPFLVQLTHGGRLHSVDGPIPTLTTANRGETGLVEPFLVQPGHGAGGGRGDAGRYNSLEEPLGALPTSNRFGIVEPFIVELSGTTPDNLPRSARGADAPLGAIRAGGQHHAVVEPFILQQQSGGVARPVSQPAPTVAAKGAVALVEPYLTKYTSTGAAYSVDAPIDTITTRDRYGLVQPVVDGGVLDIRFRMLQPHELAAATGFGTDYAFSGNKGDVIRQIGNAVVCEMAEALCAPIVEAFRPARNRQERSA